MSLQLELYKRIITGEDNKVDTEDNGDDTYSENIDSNNKLESLPITCNYVPTRKITKFTIASNHRNTTFQFNPPVFLNIMSYHAIKLQILS